MLLALAYTTASASQRLTAAEAKYSVGELEALACMWAGTDHQALLVTLLGAND